jgi:hypothetical protein
MVIEYEYLWILTYEYFTWLRYLVCSILSACGIVGREIESRQKIKLLPNTSVKQIDLYLKVISILSLTKICCCTSDKQMSILKNEQNKNLNVSEQQIGTTLFV